ncbi:dihydrodipicolinate synthase family protein [Paenarthrobacter ilicis]|uniref:dihydrodipicolinate synthase family protein n=1 Tax=Paenarthrobacter ilicis TaxID=43665 RepID=UPI0028D1A453|nr:dihydrodipicolinate synthase family protein [Paenarthrobacter ilicis]
MTTLTTLRGIYPALVTPFAADGTSVDTDALKRHVGRLIDSGVHGLIVGGTTGEFTTLSLAERKVVHETAVRAADGRVPVVVQTGALSTEDAVDLALHAESIGADGIMVIAPFYEGLTFDEVKQYFRDITSVTSLPVMFYHFPDATLITLSPAQFAELAEISGIASVKFSSYETEVFEAAREAVSGKLQIINGIDTEMLTSLSSGAGAVVLGTANVVPKHAVALFNAVTAGDEERVNELWAGMQPLLEYIEQGKYVHKVKAALDVLGQSAGPVRKPLLPLPVEEHAELKRLIDALPTA